MRWHPEDAFRYLNREMEEAERERFEADVRAHAALARWCDQARRIVELAEKARLEAEDAVDWRQVRLAMADASTRRFAPAWLLPALGTAVIAAAIALILWAMPGQAPPRLDEPTQPPAAATAAGRAAKSQATASPGELASPDVTPASPAFAMAELEAAPSKLADGSQVQGLRRASWEAIENRPDRVRIRLHEGTIAIRVTRSTTRAPFVVEAGGVEIRVLGTAFVVDRSERGTVRVDVAEGLVGVSHAGGGVQLAAGQSRTFAAEAAHAAHGGAAETAAHAPVAKAASTAHREERSGVQRAETRSEEEQKKLRPHIDSKRPTTAPPLIARELPPRSAATEAEAPASAGGAPAHMLAETRPESVGGSAPLGPPLQLYRAPSWDAAHEAYPPALPGNVEVNVTTPGAREELERLVELIRSGDTSGALDQLDGWVAAHSTHPNLGDAQYLRGYCLFAQGRREEAIAVWKRLEANHGESPWLRTVRDWTDPPLPLRSKLR